MAIKNQALTVTYYAWDTGNNEGKTGDSGNHTIYVSIDGVANAADNSPAEVDSTNLTGMYSIALTSAEMNGDHIMVGGESATGDIIIVPTSISTERGDIASLFTTALTESYSTDGSTMTVAQALYAIQQFLQERDVSGTTLTVKKLDGSTTAYTLTLDDATEPANITRTG